MRKTQDNLILLNGFFIASLLMANVLSSKMVFLFGLTIPAAVVAYPWTFLCTDVIGEIWGREEANKTVKRGIIMQLFGLILIYGAIYLPIAPFAADFQGTFAATLGNSGRIVFASLLAYLVAQTNDVLIFHHFKEKHGEQKKWLRNNVSTMISQLLDTVIFITVAFYGAVPSLLTVILCQYFIKLLIAFGDTPLFYVLTKK